MNFLGITNAVLLRLNEVTLQSGNFAAARGFHAAAKDAVNSAIRDIQQAEIEWPFNHVTATQVLDGANHTQFYALPADAESIDWESFYLVRDDALDCTGTWLKPVSYDEWLQRHRHSDDNNSTGSIPHFVIRDQKLQFGVSPVPDKNYMVTFEYWKVPSELVNYTDEPNIPAQFQSVIVDGAMYYAYMFRDNMEQAQLTQRKFEQGIKRMRTLLINRYQYIRDGRI